MRKSVNTSNKFSTFGSTQPNPNNLNANQYRYGFGGMEQDKQSSSYTTYFRQYDPRIARWKSTDPVTQPWQSPYTAFDNNPIFYTDPSGAIAIPAGVQKGKDLDDFDDLFDSDGSQLFKKFSELVDYLSNFISGENSSNISNENSINTPPQLKKVDADSIEVLINEKISGGYRMSKVRMHKNDTIGKKNIIDVIR